MHCSCMQQFMSKGNFVLKKTVRTNFILLAHEQNKNSQSEDECEPQRNLLNFFDAFGLVFPASP